MTVELKFGGLSPETALALLSSAAAVKASENGKAQMVLEGEIPAAPTIAESATLPLAPPIPIATGAITQPVAPHANAVPPVIPTAPPIPTAAVPTAVKQYTADELALAARPLAESGRQQELIDLLHTFSYTDSAGTVRTVQSIRELPPDLYPLFANGLRALGGRI